MRSTGDTRRRPFGRTVQSWVAGLLLTGLGVLPAWSPHALAQAGGTQARTAVQTVVVPARGQQLLSLPGLPMRVAVGDPEVADVEVVDGGGGRAQLLLVGHKAGQTEVTVWMEEGGTPRRYRVQVPLPVQQALAARGQAPQAHVDAVGDRALITGESDSMLSHRSATESAASGGGTVVDMGAVRTSAMVQVEVKVVELSRSVMKGAGIRWGASGSRYAGGVNLSSPQSMGGAQGTLQNMRNTTMMGQILGGAVDLLSMGSGFSLMYGSRHFVAALDLLEANGIGRILAEPTLVAMSGQSASFLAGGEVPVPVSGGLGTQSVEYKPFGIALTVSPTVLGPDRIALKVAPEASELDYSNAVPVTAGDQMAFLPAFRTRRADTMIELGDGESFVISGLVSRQTAANVSKVPFLGDLPIIGAFFRNLQYTQDERELVIVVTPRLVRPLARDAVLPLPGARSERRDTPGNAWGYYLTGRSGRDQAPGFSR